MAAVRLSLEQRKLILKWYWKSENICEVQRWWRREFETTPPTRLTISRIRDKFEADGTVQDVHKQRSGRPRTSTGEGNVALVMQAFARSPRNSVRQCARETLTSRTSVHRILKAAKWKPFIMPKNIEIKAKVSTPSDIHALARELSGSDGTIINQEDTFFNVPNGRLKLRKILGQKEELIFYTRPDRTGPKISTFKKVERPLGGLSEDLKDLLSVSLGVKGQVIKKRTLYMVDQTRVHIDEVQGLGNFMELEVMLSEDQTPEEGEIITKDLMKKLSIQEKDLIDKAYVDLLVQA